MTTTNFEKSPEEIISELNQYIDDERIIRILLKNNIYYLRDIQKEAIIKGLYFNKSFLVVAPSGSGKTLIGELCIVNNIFKNYGKAVYLVPFKALASEKYQYFKKNYSKYGIKTELSIGDIVIDDKELQKADIIITTYEKMDSILRNYKEEKWINEITTIIIDEIHCVGESERGPRLESLIVRLNEFLINPQIIALSATVANPEFFCDWLSSLGQEFILIISNERPVPLKYDIKVSQNKDSTIKHYVNEILKKKGQIIIFMNKRKEAQKLALYLKNFIKKKLDPQELSICKKLSQQLENIKGGITELKSCIKAGVAFHHAGLLSKERQIIEEYFNKRILKVICSTTTLSAGINTPARMVIIKDFKRYQTSVDNITDFSKFYEDFSNGFTYFEPFSRNQIFQMLGRAGRPGLDLKGYGIILVKNIEEKIWVEDHYFQIGEDGKRLVPIFNPIQSAINSTETLREQVLLRVFEQESISFNKLKNFFEKTYYWNCIKDKIIPIDQFLRIKEITPENILKLHSNPEILEKIKNSNYQTKITNISKDSIDGIVKTDFGIFHIRFNIDNGITCSCNFNNRVGEDLLGKNSCSFIFCNHVSSFFLSLVSQTDINITKYVNDIIPKSVRGEYILDYLIEKGLLLKERNKLICSNFGKLIIKLYLYPSSGVKIRKMLENGEVNDYKSLIKCSFVVLKSESRIRNMKMMKPLIWWADEEPLQNVLDEFKIYAGDLFSIKENIIRIIKFIGIIASYLDDDKTANLCETLIIRITHGIREELFDLVLRLRNVGRVRGRILFNAGYHIASKVLSENPHMLRHKTGLNLTICKSIIQSTKLRKNKSKLKEFEGFNALA